MALFKRKKPQVNFSKKDLLVQTRPKKITEIETIFGSSISENTKNYVYRKIRDYIPIVDAAFEKIEKITGSFKFSCKDKKAENFLNDFALNVKVGHSMTGLYAFLQIYLDSLLMYGNAVGEIVLDKNYNIKALYNANIDDIFLCLDKDGLDVDVYVKGESLTPIKTKNKNLILFSSLNPNPGEVKGKSMLSSLPFVSDILMKIYNAVGENFDRVGNIRFSINYNPKDTEIDNAYAKERAELIAKEWSDAMSCSKNGQIKDFISVGDVKITAIGADNQLLDCQIPARQMIEQIVAKLSIPPFMLGLSWSTTERMCEQQSKFFIEEISYYRRLLNPIILKIAKTALYLNGFITKPKICWSNLNFADEYKAAQVKYLSAQTRKLENEENLTQL